MEHLLNWVEIPVIDLRRATEFYGTIFSGIEFLEMEQNGNKYVIFPSMDQFNSGALVQWEYYRPSSDGISIYLDCREDMDNILKHVEKAGGEIIMSKTYTGKEAGYVGMFLDTEGNKIGLQHM
jgi:predicted enzyme related to lactoylglutathione lyase